jgi:hypothetical protein
MANNNDGGQPMTMMMDSMGSVLRCRGAKSPAHGHLGEIPSTAHTINQLEC